MSLTTALGYTPIYRITKGGSDITGQFNDRTLVIQIESIDGGGVGDVGTITLDDRDFSINSPINDGADAATLDIFLGYAEGALYEQGNFQIFQTIYSGPPKTMQLKGNSLGFTTAAKSPLITSYDGKTVGDIVSAIAKSAGVTAAVDGSLASQQIKYMNQHSSSMHLLQELERRYNGLAKFQDGKLSFTQRGTGLSVSGAQLTPFTLTPEDFGVWSVTETLRHSYSQVKASYWDANQHKLVWLANNNQSTAQNAVPEMIKRAFNTQGEAQSAANSRMDASNRAQATGTLTLAKGDPSIRGQTPFTITGMREGIDGDWIVKKATHVFSKGEGITTTLEFYTSTSGGGGGEGGDSSTTAPAETTGGVPLGQGGIGHE